MIIKSYLKEVWKTLVTQVSGGQKWEMVRQLNGTDLAVIIMGIIIGLVLQMAKQLITRVKDAKPEPSTEAKNLFLKP